MAKQNVIEAIFKANTSQFISGLKTLDSQMAALKANMQGLSAKKVKIDTTQVATAVANANKQIDRLNSRIESLRAQRAQVNVKYQGQEAEQRVANLTKQIDKLEADKVDILTRLRGDEEVVAALGRIQRFKEAVEGDPIDILINTKGADGAGGLSALNGDMDDLVNNLTNRLPVGGSAAAGALKRLGAGTAAFAAATVLAVGATGKLAFSYAQMASALEQTQLRMDILLSSDAVSGRIYDQLTDYSAQSLSSFESLTTGILRLASSGEVLESNLIPYMQILDDTAAATGANAGEVAIVLSQMYNKGKIYYEELLQLAERNIPAVAILREEMGLTAEELDGMARRGELTGDAIDALIRGLERSYGGSMALMMDTLNGRMENIRTNLDLFKASLGKIPLDEFEDAVVVVSELVYWLRTGAEASADFWTATRNVGPFEFDFKDLTPIQTLLGPFEALADAIRDVQEKRVESNQAEIDSQAELGRGLAASGKRYQGYADAMDRAAGVQALFGGGVEDISDALKEVANLPTNPFAVWRVQMEGGVEASEAYAKSLDQLVGSFSNLSDVRMGLQDAREAVALVFDEISRSGSDMRDAFDEAVKASGDFALNLDITSQGGRELRDMIQESVQAIDDLAASELNAGRSIDGVNSRYDKRKQKLIDEFVALGVNREAVENYIASIEATPTEKETKFKAILAEEQLRAIVQKYDAAVIDRAAPFLSKLDTLSYDSVQRALNILAQNRTVSIEVAYRVANAQPGEDQRFQNQANAGKRALPEQQSSPIVNVRVNGRQLESEVVSTWGAIDRDNTVRSLLGVAQ